MCAGSNRLGEDQRVQTNVLLPDTERLAASLGGRAQTSDSGARAGLVWRPNSLIINRGVVADTWAEATPAYTRGLRPGQTDRLPRRGSWRRPGLPRRRTHSSRAPSTRHNGRPSPELLGPG